VSKFYIFDHNSTLPSLFVLWDYMQQGLVDYQYFLGATFWSACCWRRAPRVCWCLLVCVCVCVCVRVIHAAAGCLAPMPRHASLHEHAPRS
jgi:hypothetical protein